MHNHPLHRDIEVECQCCWLIQPFRLTSEHDQVICKACIRHVGHTLHKTEQRSKDHLGLWRSEVQMLNQERDDLRALIEEERVTARETRRQLESEIDRLTAALTQGLSDTSPADIQQLLTQHLVQEADNKRDAAYRSRDRLYQLLWRLDEKHRPDHLDVCICGDRRCSVLEVVDHDAREELYRWERQNIERSRKGYPHGLPRDHPDYRDWQLRF